MVELASEYPVQRLSKVLEVSRAQYYRREDSGPRAIENEALLVEIIRVFNENKQRYGSPRVFTQLQQEDISCSENRVAGLMRKAELKAITSRRKTPKTTDSSHGGPVAPNLLKNMEITAPNQVWAMDITYIHCGDSWVYLAAVLDLYLHKIVGWQLAEHMKSELVEDALRRAVERQGNPKGVLVHSDRGSQYASDSFIKLTESLEYIRSMSAKGNCYDNATMESFFGVLKREELNRWEFSNMTAVRHHVFEYIETYYNRKRIHTTLGMSPLSFEKQQLTKVPSAEFSEAGVAPQVGKEVAGEKTPRPQPVVTTSGYPLESCSPAELPSVSPDISFINQSNLDINKEKEYHLPY